MICCIVIPVYLPEVSADEYISVIKAIEVLGEHNHCIVYPEGLDISTITEIYASRRKECMKIAFRPSFFKNISGYNRLLLSPHFYECFTNYDYILIYQTDAYIFKDNIQAWCEKKYDYIGAPWINWEWSSFYARHLTLPRRILYKLGYRNFNLVGNGGLSLRKVKSCISNLKFFNKQASTFSQNEDYFFSFFLTSYNPFFRVPDVPTALQFAFDENPEIAYEKNKFHLPMGCHAWPKNREFWKKYIYTN